MLATLDAEPGPVAPRSPRSSMTSTTTLMPWPCTCDASDRRIRQFAVTGCPTGERDTCTMPVITPRTALLLHPAAEILSDEVTAALGDPDGWDELLAFFPHFFPVADGAVPSRFPRLSGRPRPSALSGASRANGDPVFDLRCGYLLAADDTGKVARMRDDIERRNKARDREIPVEKRSPGPGQTRPEMLACSPAGTPRRCHPAAAARVPRGSSPRDTWGGGRLTGLWIDLPVMTCAVFGWLPVFLRAGR